MRYKHVIMSAIVTWGIALCSLCSCTPDPVYSKHPEYYGKTLYFTDADHQSLTVHTQNDVNRIYTCNAGDKVTVFLPVYIPGEYIYETTYKWSYALYSDPNKTKLGGKDIADDKDPCSKKVPPMWTFEAPAEPGEYVMYFRAVYSYSAMAPNGSGAIKGEFPANSGSHGYENGNGGKSSVYGILRVK